MSMSLDEIAKVRDQAFDEIRSGKACDYSEDCGHEYCQEVHGLITDCNKAYTALADYQRRVARDVAASIVYGHYATEQEPPAP